MVAVGAGGGPPLGPHGQCAEPRLISMTLGDSMAVTVSRRGRLAQRVAPDISVIPTGGGVGVSPNEVVCRSPPGPPSGQTGTAPLAGLFALRTTPWPVQSALYGTTASALAGSTCAWSFSDLRIQADVL